MSGRFAPKPSKLAFAGTPQEYEGPRSAPGSAVKASPAGGIFKSAAVAVLRRERRLMTTGEICRLALDWGLLNCQGKTPEATMASSMYGDIKRKDRRSTFIRPQEGLFGLREWVEEGYLPALPEHSTPMPHKRSHKASRQLARGRKRARRGREDEASDYFTEEESEDSLISAELAAASSDSEAAQGLQRPTPAGRGRPRGRPRRNIPPGAAEGQLQGGTVALLLGGAGAAAGGPVCNMFSCEPLQLGHGFEAAFQASYGFGLVHHLAMPQQQAMANPIGPLVPEPGQAWGSSPLEMATLDLGLIQNADKDHLSPPLCTALQSPLLPACCLPLLLLNAGRASGSGSGGSGGGSGSIFSPGGAFGLTPRAFSPLALHSPVAAPEASPDVLSLDLPPGLPALSLPLPAVPAVAAPAPSASLPSSAIKPSRPRACSQCSSLGSALVRRGCEPCCAAALQAGGGPGGQGPGVEPISLMVPLSSGGTTVSMLSAPAASGVHAGLLMRRNHGMPGAQSASLPALNSEALLGPSLPTSSSAGGGMMGAGACTTADVAALVSKIVELEIKVAGVVAKWGSLHPKTGDAYKLLARACGQPGAEPLFREKAQAAKDRALQIELHNSQACLQPLLGCDTSDGACLLQGVLPLHASGPGDDEMGLAELEEGSLGVSMTIATVEGAFTGVPLVCEAHAGQEVRQEQQPLLLVGAGQQL